MQNLEKKELFKMSLVLLVVVDKSEIEVLCTDIFQNVIGGPGGGVRFDHTGLEFLRLKLDLNISVKWQNVEKEHYCIRRDIIPLM